MAATGQTQTRGSRLGDFLETRLKARRAVRRAGPRPDPGRGTAVLPRRDHPLPVLRPGGDRHPPQPLLPADARDGLRQREVHHQRRRLRLAHPERPPLGRQPDDHLPGPPRRADLRAGRLQVPARADLDRRASACSRRRSASASPATCCRGTSGRSGRRRSAPRSRDPCRSSADSLLGLLRGGADVTEATLSRFFGMHVLVLPARSSARSCWSSISRSSTSSAWRTPGAPNHGPGAARSGGAGARRSGSSRSSPTTSSTRRSPGR